MVTSWWNPDLPETVQDHRLRRAVERIYQRHSNVSLFALTPEGCALPPPISGNWHLESRVLSRLYSPDDAIGGIKKYFSRDQQVLFAECQNVASIVTLLYRGPQKLDLTSRLAGVLEKFPVIGGHHRQLEDFQQLTDLLNLDLALEWGALLERCRKASSKDLFDLVFLLGTMAFAPEVPQELILIMVAFALFDDLKAIEPPKHPSYAQFVHNQKPDATSLVALTKDAQCAFVPSLSSLKNVRGQLALERLRHEQEALQCCTLLVGAIMEQWPKSNIAMDLIPEVSPLLADRSKALELIAPEWTRLTWNYEYSRYLDQVQALLNQHGISGLETSSFQSRVSKNKTSTAFYPTRPRGGGSITVGQLLQLPLTGWNKEISPSLTDNHSILQPLPNGVIHSSLAASAQYSESKLGKVERNEVPQHVQELRSIVTEFSASKSSMRKRFGDELQESVEMLKARMAVIAEPLGAFNPQSLQNDIWRCRERMESSMQHINAVFQRDARFRWLEHAGWPSITILTLLAELRSTAGITLSRETKQVLVQLGVIITDLQRLLRIQDASTSTNVQRLMEERQHLNHQNWSPMEYVDWLLLEIDSNMTLRPEQVEVALATISPQSKANSVLQLLMGKGKTSCIMRKSKEVGSSASSADDVIAMVALVLANRQNLFRIVVPRALLLQSAQIMQAKLGGLLNREVMHIPFTRGTQISQELMQLYRDLHSGLRNNSGVLLALPEHILSFKLSGLQHLSDANTEQANMMINAQDWLDSHCRDVLDESDVS